MNSATPLTQHETKRSSHLKSITHNILQRPIILQDIHKLQVVSLANLIIRRVMCGCDFDGTCSKGHVNCEGICDDGQTAGDEGVFRKFSVKMLIYLFVIKMAFEPTKTNLVPWIVWVYRNCCITEHGFGSCGRNDNSFICPTSLVTSESVTTHNTTSTRVFDFIREANNHSELEFFFWVIARDREKCAAF